MDPILLATQALNGLQLGVMLFLMAAGMTLVFGIMGLINLAHGSLYMAGAYAMAATFGATGSFLAGLGAALAAVAVLGAAMEYAVLRRLYARDHLDQVLATFGFILVFNELARMIWGPAALFLTVPAALSHTVEILPGAPYPAYRLAVIGAGIAVAIALYLLIARTRLGMLIRAGASNRTMVSALGVDIGRLYTLVFALGAALAGLAGAMAGPVLSVEPGMGEPVLILTLVVIVVGGIGSIRGAFVAALLIGFIDTIGRAFLPALLRDLLAPSAANAVGPALASMLIYLTMAVVLAIRPQGLFAARTG
ncbi:branched-chain amino acid transport system permease protein [Stella humosa]|uniref:Branched-chain amino acid transport system permease protein n=1 Tax=Stella humosa TaxID=94 RepID=A0A3N1MKN0_9PROT|nr:branched-chain amino acid ABC transporter permease [Stella humosa]ROQ01546.1 branched-chain amino acid transport system permease protein [Stella humosa]BBK31926.1 branched-chain amino acid ABC transporter permease [Stella humosa]